MVTDITVTFYFPYHRQLTLPYTSVTQLSLTFTDSVMPARQSPTLPFPDLPTACCYIPLQGSILQPANQCCTATRMGLPGDWRISHCLPLNPGTETEPGPYNAAQWGRIPWLLLPLLTLCICLRASYSQALYELDSG